MAGQSGADARLTEADHARVYSPGARKAHLRRPDDGDSVLCDADPRSPTGWMGTGKEPEYDHARKLPTCPACLEILNHRLPGPGKPGPP